MSKHVMIEIEIETETVIGSRTRNRNRGRGREIMKTKIGLRAIRGGYEKIGI